MIAGLPATGKTSFARYLSKRTKIPMISKDIVKERLFDTIGFKSRNEKVALGIAATELMYHFAEALLELGKPVILENNFENVSRPALIKLIEKHGCKTVTVRFYTEISVLAERFIIRDRSPERHRGHVVNTRYPEGEDAMPDKAPGISIEQYTDRYYTEMKQRGMENFSIGGDEIVVDTTDFSKVSYERICNKLGEICPCIDCNMLTK